MVGWGGAGFGGVGWGWMGEKEIFLFGQTGLKMATDTVANAIKMVRLATRSFQAVAPNW